MKVNTRLLRQATTILLNHLDELEQSEVEMEEDFYWNILPEELYDPYNKPVELNMGQLTDDLEEIRRIVSGESPRVGYGLVWLSSILRRLGEKAIG